MAIAYSMKAEGDLLLVTSSGRDDSLDDVTSYGMAVIAAAVEGGTRRILCDERNLVYQLSTFANFEAARFVAEQAPRVARIAIVCRPECLADGEFWETVAVNRGLNVIVTADYEKARAWVGEVSSAGAGA